jgi:transposase-like protein
MGRGTRFDEAFKREAVVKAEGSGNVSQTARELGMSGKTLHSWMKQYGQRHALDVNEASPDQLLARVRELEQALMLSEKQVEVLKKAISIVSQSERNGL